MPSFQDPLGRRRPGGDGRIPAHQRGQEQEEVAHQEGEGAGVEGAQAEGDHTQGVGVRVK